MNNNRDSRIAIAQETLEICKKGEYQVGGVTHVIGDLIAASVQGTTLQESVGRIGCARFDATEIEVENETTYEALVRSAGKYQHICCLNFASATSPGGGFLRGTIAQEECLAYCSALYPTLLAAPSFYERNKANNNHEYLDLEIFSPDVPFFRNDQFALMPPVCASVITSPAPNASALGSKVSQERLRAIFQRRADRVLSLAALKRVDLLVLGAWGCGVFGNSPKMVAAVFRELLEGKFRGVFGKVVFAVYDTSKEQASFKAFQAEFPA